MRLMTYVGMLICSTTVMLSVAAQATMLKLDLIPSSGIFQNPALTPDPGPPAVIVTDPIAEGGTATMSSLVWGEPSDESGLNPDLLQSSLVLTSYHDISLNADGAPEKISQLVHNNNVLNPAAATLLSAQILGALGLSSTDGPVTDVFVNHNTLGLLPLTDLTLALLASPDVADDLVPVGEEGTTLISLFNLAFNETLNNPGFCIFGNPRGSFCDDFFLLTTEGGFPVFIELLIDGLPHELLIYSSFDETGASAEPGPNYFTAENASTTLYTFARLSPLAVPEPSAVLLIGFLLVLLASYRLSRYIRKR
ncbi:hypothetical protein [Zooshikella harenae]|uniref:PEP-CTERM sorting domain-containing protein n=1 Tax=Zooshikella harenae TaxID=2827238 RepID=A0ABS5ZF68_9GAMM|nr:hypothetical protein [Zooshikella harenae]MBU2712398.1 hypothetical protein [Zooshikella harenae]